MKNNGFLESINYKLTVASSNKVLLIFTGIGGSVSGYKNKYEKIANNMKDNFNVSTLVITMPFGSWEHMKDIFDFAIEKADNLFNCRNEKDYEIYAMGSSAGGTNILTFFRNDTKIKAICAINPVFSVDFHKIIENLKKSKIRKTIILGENDMSLYDYVLLQQIEDIEIVVIPNGDHYLSGDDNFKFFLDIPKRYLVDKNYIKNRP